ncbi:hypothetical protein RRF57_005995 [Xylaria bambusicola]|uniref:Uncharacterized protein n=1 Tax=Xylaria bambusicola TaxID=326684 RepID=A0AAN7UDJ9_9PEZI
MNQRRSCSNSRIHGKPIDRCVFIDASECARAASSVAQEDEPDITIWPSNRTNRYTPFLWWNFDLLTISSIVLVVPYLAIQIQPRVDITAGRVHGNKDWTSAHSPDLVIIWVGGIDSDHV